MKSLAAALCLFAMQAVAACPGSVVANGINLSMGTPVKLQVDAQAGCVIQAPSSLTVGGTAPGSVVTITPDASHSDYSFSPTAVGNGTVTFSAPGFATLSVPVVVSPGNLDLVTGP